MQRSAGITTITYYEEPKVSQVSLTADLDSLITLSDAERIIKAAYHGERSVLDLQDVTNSLFCPQYLITLDNRARLTLRLAAPSDVRVLEHERDVLNGDFEILELIRQNAPEVPVPEVVLHSKDGNSSLLEVPFLLTTYIPGVSLDVVRQDLPDEILAMVEYNIGQHARRINRIHNSHFGLAGGAGSKKMYTTWRSAFLSMFETVMRDAEDLFISVPYEVLRWHVGRLAYALDDVKVPQLVCYDLCDAQRAIVDERTGRLNGLLDFERAVWGDPLMESAFRDPSLAFLNGYGGSPLGAPNARPRVLLYSLYYYLQAVVEVYYHGLNHDLECKARKGLVRSLKSLSDYQG
ncbi:hypothetical protein H072_5566 [Dactylellina haptotyla CBS 200.50]|uniref:Aminoglycoside phosphotransferase domain-containing protein n=1 Tax=Dactylellina haptotyla (strain CBS 200.50) TaxID=1284197 RepID=S8BYZ2_DACHA|nr:hypothetical protein H072_5566 [Dactylellina haptotyla CBS 200.50]